jgi:hypothetical protein
LGASKVTSVLPKGVSIENAGRRLKLIISTVLALALVLLLLTGTVRFAVTGRFSWNVVLLVLGLARCLERLLPSWRRASDCAAETVGRGSQEV